MPKPISERMKDLQLRIIDYPTPGNKKKLFV